MARPKANAGDAREKLLEAAGRGFRTGGYGGIGVDGLAKEAGLTSGAFYAHFDSKADAFRLAVTDGLSALYRRVETFQEAHGEGWLPLWIDFYMNERMKVDLCEACALPTLTGDVTRSDDATRAAYSEEVGRLAALIASGLRGPESDARAVQLLTLLSGAAAMARAVADPGLRQRIIASATALAKTI